MPDDRSDPPKPGTGAGPARRVPGTAPGLLIVDDSWPRPRIRVMGYGPDSWDEQVDDPAGLPGLMKGRPVTWIDVEGLGDAAVLQEIGRVFDLHRLVLEDVVNQDQRAKTEEYSGRLFVVGRMASLPDPEVTDQVAMYIGADFVLTFRATRSDCFEGVRDRIRSGKGKIRRAGTDYLAYALLDAIIDSYFSVTEHLGIVLEALESEVVDQPSKSTVENIQKIKAALLSLRRAAWPHREVVDELLLSETDIVQDATRVYLRDCRDHATQITDLIEGYRETCSDLITLYLSSVSNRMNEVMKVLTIIATIFIPLSFVAGVYGMNFDPERSPFNMPELGWYLGYPFALVVMLCVATGFVIYLRRKGWL